MTAKVQTQAIERYLDLGAAGVVAKPFDQRTLVETIVDTWGGIAIAEPDAALDRATLVLRKDYGVRLPAKIGEIEEAWARMRTAGGRGPTAKEMHSLAHRLTGSGATYGHGEISRAAGDLAREIETMMDHEAPLHAELRTRINSLVGALRDAVEASVRA